MADPVIVTTPDQLAALVRQAVREELDARGAPTPPHKRYVTQRELSTRFAVSRTTVHNWVKQEGCPHILHGAVLRFDLEAVEAWLRARPPKLQRVK